ncbi:MAG: sugar phosphate isomerase/epimerase [Candidatus Latescibacteria bacterium]|nr:sugar phosphate isomerase/epimerase [Candidatus Latescibacterota bacterium]
MSEFITRRKAITQGIVTTGALCSAGCSKSEKNEISKSPNADSHPPFLTPWSPPSDLKRDLTPGSTPVRLGAWSRGHTTLDYPTDISITDMVKRIRDAGYTTGNSSYGQSGRNPWLEASDSEIAELKTALKTYDVTFFDMHTYTNNIHPDLETRAKNHRYVIEQCEAAERVGCPMVTTHTGTCSAEHPISPHKDNWTWDTWKLGVKVIKQLLQDTSGMNVVFGIEAVNMTASNNPRAHLRLIEDVADPRLKICLDPVNMMHLGVYYRNTELIQECFDLLGENIIACHAKDTYILPDKMSAYITELAPGKGILDYETYLVGLSRLSTPRPLLIEHIPDEQYADAKKYIEDTAAKVGVKIYG